MSSVFAYSSKTITVGSSPAGIAINTKTKEVYVADSSGDSNSISVINASNNIVIKTIKAGLEPLVTCKEGLQLITKAEDNSPACAKPQTAQRLVDRGWGHILADFYTKYASPDITAKFQSKIISSKKAVQIVQDYIKENNLALAVNSN